MGADNLTQVFAGDWATARISPQSFRLLLYLAFAAGDRPAARSAVRVFRGERWTLARAIGHELPDAAAATDAESKRVRANALRQIQRALADLQDAGVVTAVRSVTEGYREGLDVLEIEFRVRPEAGR